MANSLILGIRIKPNNFQRYTVQNVDLESKVYLLKEEAAKLTKTETKKLGINIPLLLHKYAFKIFVFFRIAILRKCIR